MPSKSEHEVTLKQVADSSSPLFELCLGILRESIPPSEQLGDRRLKKLLARDDYRIYALLLNETVAATAILYLPKTSRFVLLDYMGVRLDLRGRGVGSTLFRELVRITSRERPAAGYLIFEVDDDREDFSHADSVNHGRIDFYHRLGAQLLSNANYFFPSPTGPGVPMRLMVYQLHSETKLTRNTVSAAVENIFLEIHGRQKNDPLLRSILDHLPSHLILE